MAQKSDTEANEEQPTDDVPLVRQELSKVAASPRQSILILVAVIGLGSYLIFNFFFNNKSTSNEETKVEVPTTIAKPAEVVESIPAIPQLPEPPKIVEPPQPPPPPPPPLSNNEAPLTSPSPNSPLSNPLPANETANNETTAVPQLMGDEEARKRKELKRRSSIVLIAGTEPKKTAEQVAQENDFKKRGNLELTLGKGKIIDAVLESAVNTDFGGEIRSVVSRDVFSEGGKVILIPKGSKVFGNYSMSTDGAYGRIAVEWTRIDLASGYSLNLQGTGMDNLGRKGYQGRVDNKFKERLSNAILISSFNIAFANALDKVVAPPSSSDATAANTETATNMQNTALAIYNDPNKTEDVKVAEICASTQALITDKSSSAYTSLVQSCTTIPTMVGAKPGEKLNLTMNAVNSSAATLISTSTTESTPTQAQNASKQAFTDVTNTFKDMLTQQQFKPTITIDQGTPIKIYVNRDYLFPKAAATIKSRVIK